MKTFVIGDIHGCYAHMMDALDIIESRELGGTVVFLGDYIDRGPHSRAVIDTLIEGPPDNWKWVILKGNHEDMLIETINKNLEVDWWIDNGGDATLASYGQNPFRDVDLKLIPPSHIEFMANLPSYAEDKHRVYVHGGINSDKDDLIMVSDRVLLWHRYLDSDTRGYRGKHVVHGHTPITPLVDRTFGDRTNLDGGVCFKGGKLLVGVFDDDTPGAPLEVIQC